VKMRQPAAGVDHAGRSGFCAGHFEKKSLTQADSGPRRRHAIFSNVVDLEDQFLTSAPPGWKKRSL